jgi:glycosyltransferase involved in cell wall biosynthesis
MGAMEAQAAGMVPVDSRKAALAETVFCGGEFTQYPDDLDRSAAGLRHALTHDWTENKFRDNIHAEACKRFDYDTLADEWVELIKREE